MATWGDQTCQRFEATAVGFETGFSRQRVRPSNRYAIAPLGNLEEWLMRMSIQGRKCDAGYNRERMLGGKVEGVMLDRNILKNLKRKVYFFTWCHNTPM